MTLDHKQHMENCWKRIGIWGREEPRCPELKNVIHCSNCPVFNYAGRTLFERPLPEGYREEWSELLATVKDEDLPGTISVVIFRIEEEWLALRTQIFAEIIDPARLHRHIIPHRKSSVLIGIINVHGDIQLCVSLKALLGIETNVSKREDRREYKRMIVIGKENERWVFPVNEIYGVVRVHPSIFQNVPVTVSKAQSTYTKEIFQYKDKHVAFLDDELLRHSLTRSVQ